MDYAFAPGVSTYDRILRDMLTFRPQTTVVNNASVVSINDFFTHLQANVATPLTNIIIASHGSESAWMKAQLDTVLGPNTTYEDLTQAMVAPRTCQIAASVIDPRPVDGSNNPITPFLFIKGCRIGKSVPFIQKIKEVINGLSTTSIELCAPIFYHVVYQLTQGVFEYFEYDFHIYRKVAIADKPALIAAFNAEGFSDIHGTPIPSASYTSWIPRRITNQVDPLATVNIASSPVTNFATHRAGRYQYKNPAIYAYTVDPSVTLPANNAAAIATFLKSELAAFAASGLPGSEKFVSTHPFPYYERFGYTSIDDMVDNLNWVKPATSRTYTGKRHEYHVNPAVVGATNNELVYNFYPATGSTATASQAFTDNNATYFQTA